MVLQKIVASCQAELEAQKRLKPPAEMRRLALEQPPPLDLAKALKGDGVKLIAEVKKASPSRGVIRPDFDPAKIALSYAASGAAAISVLTESSYFQGSLGHLKDIRKALGDNQPPLLRKDFIVDPYQVYQSRASGADSLLLIVAILAPEKLAELLDLSHRLGMNCLVEVHNESELETALKSDAQIIGINNRDLDTFNVDIATTGRLRPLIPQGRIVVSESGIRGRRDVEKMQKWRVDAILIGEWLMSAPDIAVRIKELLS